MEKIGSAKSSIVRGKGKAEGLGKSVAKLIDLNFGLPKSSSTFWSQNRKWSENKICELMLPNLVSLQNDLKSAVAVSLGLLTLANLEIWIISLANLCVT